MNIHKSFKQPIWPAVLATAMGVEVMMPNELSAVILTWDGGTDGLFSEAGNWSEGVAPDGDDSLVFAGTINTIIDNDLAADTIIEGIEFTNTANGESFALAGNRIQLTGDIETTTVVNSSVDAIEDTISFDIVLNAANLGINTGAGHNVTLSGALSGAEQLDVNNGSNAQDDGVVTLAGANTYTGGTRLMGGTLVAVNNSALGTGALIMEDRSNTNPVFSIGQNGLNIGNEIIFSNRGGSKTVLFDLAGTNAAELSGNFVLNETGGSNNRIVIAADNTLTHSGMISGVGRLALYRSSSGGTLVLSGDNTFSGGFLLEEGTLRLEHNNALGTGVLTIDDRGVNPVLDLADGLTVANAINISNRGGNKRIQLSGTGSVSATLNGAIAIEETSARAFDFSIGSNDVLTLGGVVSGTTSAGVEKLSGGTLVLANDANSFAGNLYITSGTVVAGTIGDSGVSSSVGSGSIVHLGGNNASGTLRYTGSGGSSNRQFSVGNRTSGNNRAGGGSLLNDGSGALVFTNANFNVEDPGTAEQVGPRTLTLGGSYVGGVNEVSGGIIDNRSTGFIDESVGLVKTGASSWALSGTNAYSGTTEIVAGTLLVNGDSSAATGAVSVDAGATLGGTGELGGAVSVDGSLAPGAGNVAVLKAPSVAFADGASFVAELDSSVPVSSGADLVVLSGDLNLSGDVALDISDIATSSTGFVLATKISLFNYDGSWNGGEFTYLGATLGDDTRFVLGLNEWLINYDDTSGGANFAVSQIGSRYVTLTAVPEPRAYGLVSGALVLGFVLRRRVRRCVRRTC